MINKYDTYNHAKTYIRYHIIFSTKYRKDILGGLKDDLTIIFNDISSVSNFKIIRMGFDGTHVHLFIKSCPTFSILEIVRRLKQVSTRRIWKKRGDYLKQFYWKKRHIWTNGYFCSTIGEISSDVVLEYIEKQG